jgi:hypothetical protein
MFYALRLKDVGVKDILAIVHQIFIRKTNKEAGRCTKAIF